MRALRAIVLLSLSACAEPAATVPTAAQPPVEATPPAPPADTTAPAFPAEAVLLASAPGRLGAEARDVTLRWPQAATDEVGVTAYVVRVDGAEVARVDAPADQTTVSVAFEAARTFSVVAVDAAGNESAPLTTGDALAPRFPDGAQVSVERRGAAFVLTWPAAEDDVGVSAYTVQRGEVELASLTPETRSYRLADAGEQDVSVVAVDAAGHKTPLATDRLRIGLATARVESLLLGALGDSQALADVLAAGAVTNDVRDVLATSEGVGVASSSGGVLRERPAQGEALGGISTGTRGMGQLVTSPSGQVAIDEPVSTSGAGRLDSAVVTRALRVRVAAFRVCYERELRATPTLAGGIVLSFTVEPSGSVTGAAVTTNTTASDALASCVVRAVSVLRVDPAPEGGAVRLTYPLRFTRAS